MRFSFGLMQEKDRLGLVGIKERNMLHYAIVPDSTGGTYSPLVSTASSSPDIIPSSPSRWYSSSSLASLSSSSGISSRFSFSKRNIKGKESFEIFATNKKRYSTEETKVLTFFPPLLIVQVSCPCRSNQHQDENGIGPNSFGRE